MAFVSDATNLVPGDAEGTNDIFVKDLVSGAIARASTSAGGERGNDGSDHPSLAAGGTRVAFDSEASNLVPGDTNGVQDVFVRDLTPTSSAGDQGLSAPLNAAAAPAVVGDEFSLG